MDGHSRFSISLDLVNLQQQEPNRNRYESKYFWDELFSLIPAAGFNSIEIPYLPRLDLSGRVGVPMSRHTIITRYGSVEAFCQLLKDEGIHEVTNVTFNPSFFLRGSIDSYVNFVGRFIEPAIQFAAETGAGRLTLTPAQCYARTAIQFEKAVPDWTAWKADFAKRTAEMINTLAIKAAASHVTISVKNEYWGLLRDVGYKAFVQQLDSQVLLNIDTAHIAIQGDNVVDKIKEASGRIGSVHLTDTSYVDLADNWKKDVNPEFPSARPTQVFRDVGLGTVDLVSAVNALSKTDYKGQYILSCRQTRDVSRALLRSRRLVNKITGKQ
ncbi:MAG: sugar phosphate isomerase/epimerase family protein [Saccharofermentanales bacterium]|jgi:inosose dehydratase